MLVRDLPRLNQGNHLGSDVLHQALGGLKQDSLSPWSEITILIVCRDISTLKLGKREELQKIHHVLTDSVAINYR